MKYFKQWDGYSCGPLAIMNTMLWLGIPIERRDIWLLRTWCLTVSTKLSKKLGVIGTTFTNIDKVISSLPAEVCDITPFSHSIKKIDKKLKDGYMLVIATKWFALGREQAHVFNCFWEDGKYYFINPRVKMKSNRNNLSRTTLQGIKKVLSNNEVIKIWGVIFSEEE
jgi:hypothetical protein